jgi:NADH-quinone oxidoreductase subunit N
MIARIVQDAPVQTLAAEAASGTPEIIWSAIAPNLILMLGGVLLLTVVSLLRGKSPSWFPAAWTVVTAALALLALFPLWARVQDEGAQTVMAGAVGLDGFSLFVTGIICLSVIMGALLLEGYVRREGLEGAEWYVLLLLSASGGVTMASANDLIVMFIGLEILSVAAYVLTACIPSASPLKKPDLSTSFSEPLHLHSCSTELP